MAFRFLSMGEFEGLGARVAYLSDAMEELNRAKGPYARSRPSVRYRTDWRHSKGVPFSARCMAMLEALLLPAGVAQGGTGRELAAVNKALGASLSIATDRWGDNNED
jgi:hypothetical protein